MQSIIDFIKGHLIWVAAGAVAIWFFFFKKARRRRRSGGGRRRSRRFSFRGRRY